MMGAFYKRDVQAWYMDSPFCLSTSDCPLWMLLFFL